MKSPSAIFAALLVGQSALLFAQEINSIPVGSITTTIAAGNPSGRTITVLSLPLNGVSTASGQIRGVLTGVAPNTLSNSNAGWTPGALSSPATPHVIRITTGAAAGRCFLISTTDANTSTTITIDSEDGSLVDLSAVGIAASDSYEILSCDTLASIFGTPTTTGIQGGANSTEADVAQILVQGQYRQYYFNTTRNEWVRVGTEADASNVPLRPDAAVIYSRIGQSPIEFTLAGSVPSTARKALVRNSGPTLLANGWPLGITLASSGISELPGWVKDASANAADTVQINFNGAWRKYYHDGTQWRRVGTNTPSNDVALDTASGVLIGKQGTQTGANTLQQSLPYSL